MTVWWSSVHCNGKWRRYLVKEIKSQMQRTHTCQMPNARSYLKFRWLLLFLSLRISLCGHSARCRVSTEVNFCWCCDHYSVRLVCMCPDANKLFGDQTLTLLRKQKKRPERFLHAHTTRANSHHNVRVYPILCISILFHVFIFFLYSLHFLCTTWLKSSNKIRFDRKFQCCCSMLIWNLNGWNRKKNYWYLCACVCVRCTLYAFKSIPIVMRCVRKFKNEREIHIIKY